MYFYQHKGKIMFSVKEFPFLTKIDEETAKNTNEQLYYLKELNPLLSRKGYRVTYPNQLFQKEEGLNILLKDTCDEKVPHWLFSKVEARDVVSLNISYHDWEEQLNYKGPSKWKVNIAGLGDVGSTLLIGLRLLGGDYIDEIGIYDRDINKLNRWEKEINQIHEFGADKKQPIVTAIPLNEVFDCHLFVFCIAARVPAIGEEDVDVRMVQFNQNSEILSTYGQLAREKGFKGIFAVVSDPVDLLCKSLLESSNTTATGKRDFKGLAPDQIRGYGLGVMNARALYYSKELQRAKHYELEGRAFGPHGDGLVIADSISNYNDEISLLLTEKAKTANLRVRETGFKPYVAPALSSGALSLLATIGGEWHYSATYMGGVYMGALNRLKSGFTEVEAYNLPKALMTRLTETYKQLERII
ncbi:lactate dehydrogenase [Alkaliphilus pronyensis]|uniref:Lactate dehydrogenase n=1 Tax=Alkaliphilus pronyensis TaxID=1482732 RepID=A0A6I0F245_9FIRM|nr:lactate dehydrogenase [Alkaliphilus pronyensis]KAB3531261.1 lactate dehydrogenase [Alkaliphilus pronyensis]